MTWLPRNWLGFALLLALGLPEIAVAQVADSPTPQRGEPVATMSMGRTKPVRPGPHVAMPMVRDSSAVVIRLARGACFGACPSYSVEVRGTGEVRYHGAGHVLVEGEHRTTIAPQRVQALLKLFETSDYWSLRPKYEANITDSAAYRLSVTIDGVTKTVDDYVGKAVGMPAAVTALEDAVDSVSGVDRWVLGNDETLALLRAEGWDFRSQEAAATLARAANQAPDALVFGLIDAGTPVTVKATDPERPPLDSALENAAYRARLPLAQRLIALGAANDPAVLEEVLFAAVASRHPAMVAEILKLGPNPNVVNKAGNVPLAWIEEGPNPFYFKPELTDPVGVIRLLIAAGADPLWRDADGNTLLHGVLNADVAREFIRAGVPLEARNNHGETPILSTFSDDVVMVLLDAGADPEVRSNDGLTLRVRARRMDWKAVLTRLDAR